MENRPEFRNSSAAPHGRGGEPDGQVNSSAGAHDRSGVQMKKLSLLTLMLLCTPFLTYAQGGSCPTGANYINPANGGVAGPLVPLSAMGVRSCFYIAADGSDSNTGTDESNPWLHAPGMPNCAKGTNCHITPAAGEGFIFRGGDTWHFGTGSPQVGTAGSAGILIGWNWTTSGTSSNYVYIGVDPNWYSGSAWARPIFNNDNPVTPGGIVPSCAYPADNFEDVYLDAVSYVMFDNFEFTGMCWDNAPSFSLPTIYLNHYGSSGGSVSYRVISNNYFHGWTHPSFSCIPGNPNAGSCGGAVALRGDTNPEVGTQLLYNVIDGSDSDPLTMNSIASDAYIMAYNVVRYVGGTSIVDNCHIIHDNLWEHINNNIDGSTHSDMFMCNAEAPGNNYFYNNLVRYIGTAQQIMVINFWLTPNPGYADFFFNNVMHDEVCNGNCLNTHSPSSAAALYIYNNTIQRYSNSCVICNAFSPNLAIYDINNHWITSGSGCGAVYAQPSYVNHGNRSCKGDSFQTLAAAKAEGYTSSNDFQPTSATSITVGKGANEAEMFSTFGLAYETSTTNGCTYVTSSHALSCPAVTANTRPSTGTGVWDTGAYAFGSASGTQPAQPRNLTAIVE